MERTPIDCEKIFDDEDPDRTAVIVKQSILSDDQCRETIDSEHYGTIDTTRYGHTDGKSFMVIQFKDAISARNLIAKRCIAVWGDTFTVIPFQPHGKLIETIRDMTLTNSTYYTPTAPQKSDDNILNVLNDDCLGEVFKRMNPWDRIRMENVCSRFKRVAKKAFVSVYRKNNIWLSHLNPDGNLITERAARKNPYWAQLYPDKNLTLTEIEKFLHCYGPSINWMTLHDSDYEHIADGLNSILKLLAKYCPNIKKLNLSMSDDNDTGDRVHTQTLTKIRPLLSKLSDLSIHFTSLSICNEFIVACDEIEKLSLNISDVDSVLPKIKFLKLRSCYLTANAGIDIGVLDGFLKQNPQIEYLKIPYVTGVLRLISNKVPNLRKLNISNPEPLSTSDHLCLKSLKKANISIYSSNFNLIVGESRENLFKITSITSLKLGCADLFDLNILVELTKHLWKLEKMVVFASSNQTLSKDLIKKMLEHAKELTKLEICGFRKNKFCELDFFFRKQDYNDILHIVKNRSNLIGLNIEITNCCRHFKRHSRKTFCLKADPRWLTIISWL